MGETGQAGILFMDRALNTPPPVRKWRPPSEVEAENTARPAAAPRNYAPVRKTGSTRPGLNKPGLKTKTTSVVPSAGAQVFKPQPLQPMAAAANEEFGPVPPITAAHKLGMICICGYLLSGYGNDVSIHLLGGKAYLSWVFGPLLVLALLASGTIGRTFHSKIGKLWLGFAVCLLFSTAFSMVKGESLGQIKDYLSKTLIVYFCCTAFALTIRNVRTLVKANVFCTGVILFEALLFGAPDGAGRLVIPGSLFLGNSNDFALTLVCSLGFSLYLVFQKSGFSKALGSAQFLLTLYFMLKTGSRGGFLALIGCMAIWFLFAGKKKTLIALILPGFLVIPLVSPDTLARLVHIEVPGSISANGASGEAEMSQRERTHLLVTSIRFAVTHPLLGTGPATFLDALWSDDLAHGTHTPALGTHNSYTQVAAECGIPAFICYVWVLFGSIRMAYRMMRKTNGVPGAEPVFAIAACLLGSLVAYAVGTTFDHVAYSWTLPVLSGMAVALHMTTHGGDPEWIQSQAALGNV
jgi:hypothetical protein